MQRQQLITNETNFKQYFLEEDNLRSLQNEVIFSILRRYNCFAGCKICYVDKYFETDKSKFKRFIPDKITQEQSDLWLEVFSSYSFASTIDDLYWMKHQQPHLFEWYKEHAGIFHFGSMTDNNFIRAWNILVNEIEKPKGIYEFTFSDAWLCKVKVDEIVDKIKVVHKLMPISVIKLIQTDINSLEWDPVKKLVDWTKANDVNLIIHHDAKTFDTVKLGIDSQQHSYATFNGDMFTVCGEADYLQYDSFFHTLPDAINPNCEPYDTLDGKFDVSKHVSKHMHGKIDAYKRHLEKLKFVDGGITGNYKRYFKWVIDNLEVNHDFNFIPILSLKPYHHYYQKLLKDGWIESQYGLYKPNDLVVPLFKIK